MSVKLIDMIRLMLWDNDIVKVFDENDNLLFAGSKEELMKKFQSNQVLATRKIIEFFANDDYLVISVK